MKQVKKDKVISSLTDAARFIQSAEPLIREARNKIRKAENISWSQTDNVLESMSLDLRTIDYDLISISKEIGIELLKLSQTNEGDCDE